MLYQDFLSHLHRLELLEEYKKVYKTEQQCYKKENRKNPNHKIVYHNNYYHL